MIRLQVNLQRPFKKPSTYASLAPITRPYRTRYDKGLPSSISPVPRARLRRLRTGTQLTTAQSSLDGSGATFCAPEAILSFVCRKGCIFRSYTFRIPRAALRILSVPRYLSFSSQARTSSKSPCARSPSHIPEQFQPAFASTSARPQRRKHARRSARTASSRRFRAQGTCTLLGGEYRYVPLGLQNPPRWPSRTRARVPRRYIIASRCAPLLGSRTSPYRTAQAVAPAF